MPASVDELLNRQQELYTRIGNSVENLKKLGAAAITVGAVESRLQLLETNWGKFENLHEQLLSLATETHRKLPYFQTNTFEAAEELYVCRKGTLIDMLHERQRSVVSSPLHSAPLDEGMRSRPSLPRIQLPRFDGRYADWPAFRDLFTSLVIREVSLSNVERLHYLKTSVVGEASNLLRNVAVTASNFDHAWSILVTRYENKRLLVASQYGALSSLPAMTGESATELKRLLDSTRDIVSALEALQCPVTNGTHWLAHVTAERLDRRSRRDWETSLGSQLEPPTFDILTSFMEERLHALEAIEQTKLPPKTAPESRGRDRVSRPREAKSHHTTKAAKSAGKCALCKGTHFTRLCPELEQKSASQRRSLVISKRLCLNCLGKHSLQECKSAFRCKQCGEQHHTTLHESSSTSTSSAVPTVSSAHVARTVSMRPSAVLLATARVLVGVERGRSTEVRALIDPGSEVSLISEAVAQRLRLRRDRASVPVIGVGSKISQTTRGRVTCSVTSLSASTNRIKVVALVLPRLSAYRPRCSAVKSDWPHLQGLKLADPRFDASDDIDLILGADVYASLLRPGLCRGRPDEPIAQETIFGWVLSGLVSDESSPQGPVSAHQCSLIIDANLNAQVQRFWEQEDIASSAPLLTEPERLCEEHFCATHSRQPDGRYVVRLPLAGSPTALGESRRGALRTLFSVERRFARDPEFSNLYIQFMQEYERLGHMRRCEGLQSEAEQYYLPHHGVLKEEGKLRVVFNGSAKTTSGISLNEIQHKGPKLLCDLDEILHRWRRHRYAFTADIAKMYRQIRVHREDWDLQRIVWRETPGSEPTDYHLTTVTYGQAAAPFLAMRTLRQLAADEGHRFPRAAHSLVHDTYVDDVLTGASSIQEATSLADDLLQLCMAGGFPLSKWASNAPVVIEALPGGEAKNIILDWPDQSGRAVLGLEWIPSLDVLAFRMRPLTALATLTRRRVLSLIARLFDPLGWLAPFIVRAKVFMQSLWLLKIGWDDPLPSCQATTWSLFQDDLADIGSISQPRWLGLRPASVIQICGFADASERAYAAVVYLRIDNPSEEPVIRLVAAKTKVAPIKQLALPRLELCAAVLLAKLVGRVKDVLSLASSPTFLHTDSTIVLGWLRSHPSRWKTFVANRVAEIQTTVPSACWRHVRSEDNPADCASRGLGLGHLRCHTLWWNGPSWLVRDPAEHPRHEAETTVDLEVRSSHHAAAQDEGQDDSLLLRFSRWHRLLRVTAWCLRWRQIYLRSAQPSSDQDEWLPGVLRSGDLDEARTRWVLNVQGQHFHQEIVAVRNRRPLPARSPLLRLAPLLDDRGQLRLGGRLQRSLLSPDEQHPIILPSSSHLTFLLAEACHRRTLHGGVQLSLATLRRTFWVLQGRRVMKAVIQRCLQCIRWRAAVPQQLMAPLPSPRVRPSRPFSQAGVDYAGPILLRAAPGRGHKAYKGYVAVFVCLSTRAVHLELVSSYSTDAFLAAYRRFAARRGPAAVLYSDCGTTFVGADSELRALMRASSSTSRSVVASLATEGTAWRFIPPAAPHFGGIWEAAVKSVKHHLRRVLGDATLTYEEMSTLLCQIEACLNSRPLQPISDDPDDLNALTPGHFLVGTALTTIPEPSLLDLQTSRLSRWQLLQQMLQSFWKRWTEEYLTSLQQRPKWAQPQGNVRIGDLCLLRSELQPPSKWPLARVTAVHPGEDGHVRVVTLRTASSSSIQRPIVKLVPLGLANREG